MNTLSAYKIIAESIHNNDISAYEALSLLNNKSCYEKICIACSGGSDSVYLLDFIYEKYKNLRGRIIVLHFNHNVRGQSSDDDEIFVKNLAQQYNVDFYCERLTDMPSRVTEETLRSCRNKFYANALHRFSTKILILGHHQNDVAETLLMRLARASDTTGLSAPRALTLFPDGHIRLRPLLNTTKQEIQKILSKKNIPWREDDSNSNNDFFRNKIRNVVLPVFQSAANQFDLINALSTAKQNIEDADNAVSYFAEKFCQNHDMTDTICLKSIEEWPIAVLRKIVIRFFTKNNINIRKSCFSKILISIKQKKSCKISAGHNVWLLYNNQSLYIEHSNDTDQAMSNGIIGDNQLPNGKILQISIIDITATTWNNIITCNTTRQCFSKLPNQLNIQIKPFSPLQKYTRFGHNNKRKISDLLTSNMIIKEDRKALPMIFVNGKICWVPYLPVTNDFRLKQTDKKALLLTYF